MMTRLRKWLTAYIGRNEIVKLPLEINICVCTLVKPCHPHCTCVNGFSSRGCLRCAQYGNLEQRTAKAVLLAKWIDDGRARYTAKRSLE